MAWYYTINDQAANKLAHTNILNEDVDYIKWFYKKDVCSWKIDAKLNPAEKGGD